MSKGNLANYFHGVAARRLTPHQVDPSVSNGHEFQGSKALQAFLGVPTTSEHLRTTYIWMSDEEPAEVIEDFATWYDPRAKDETRKPEPRLLYTAASRPVVRRAQAGDTIFVALRSDRTLLIVLCPLNSVAERQLTWLFGTQTNASAFSFRSAAELAKSSIGFAARFVLEAIGIEIDDGDEWLDKLLAKFGSNFPDTQTFSAFARETVGVIDLNGDPDASLVAWLEREDTLFFTLEKHLVAARIRQGFERNGVPDVDAFLEFSLKTRQRRMSRAGNSLERHLEALFNERGIAFDARATTEGAKKPDFIFPGRDAYLDSAFPTAQLTLLGCKRTCKDRWRQVLAEGDRIKDKHLFTIEPSISETQTSEMQAARLQLIVPQSIRTTFLPDQQSWLMNLAEFIELVSERQALIP